jgi:apolipoprotein D and lipocalin family protein
MVVQVQKLPSPAARLLSPVKNTTLGCLLALMTSLLLGACQTARLPKGIETAKNFNLHKFEGTWYEIARSNNPDEAGLTHVTSQYRRGANGKWLVNTRAWQGANGRWVGSSSVSTTPDLRRPASFKLSSRDTRHVVIIDNEHTLALMCGSKYTDFWVVSKSPSPDHERVERLMAVALDAGFPVKGAFFVPTR